MLLLLNMLKALILTIIIEEIIATPFFKVNYRNYFVILLINIITNPAVNYIYIVLKQIFGINPLSIYIILLEILVILVEWKLIEYALKKKSYVFMIYSIVANSTSYIIGLLL